MLKRTISTVFHALVVLVATTVAVGLTVTGHTLQVGGLLVTMGASWGGFVRGPPDRGFRTGTRFDLGGSAVGSAAARGRHREEPACPG